MSNKNYLPLNNRYTALYKTWCGKGIDIPDYIDNNDLLVNISKTCPATWLENKIPTQSKQIVLDYKPLGYNSLTHNVPYTPNSYFKFDSAYTAHPDDQYTIRLRKCDGTFVNK
jgi:hypothetical protein